MLDLRLVPAALIGWLTTAAGIRWGPSAAAVAATGTVAVVGVIAYLGLRRRGRGESLPSTAATVGAAAVVAAGFAVAIGLRVHDLNQHPVTGRYGTTAVVVATPIESPRPVGAGRLLFRAGLNSLDERPAAGSVVVFASPAFGRLAAGQPAAFRARIERPSRKDLTVATLYASEPPSPGEAAPIQQAAQRVRADFAGAAQQVLSPDQAAILPALVLGDTAAVSGRTTDEFRAAGLAHLTAVSGANVTVVVGTVLLGAALVGPKAAVALAAVALAAFVIVVQPSPSVLRAAAMGCVTLLAVVTHRRRQAIPALAGTVVVLMIAAPQLAVDVGFALSVAATAALVLIAPVWSQRLVERGWPKPLADAVSVAAAAQLATAPLIAGVTGTFSTVSVLANLAVAVVIPPITVLGTSAAAVAALWPGAALVLIRFTGPELWWLLTVAHWAGRVPGASVPVPSGVTGVFVLAAGGLALTVAWRWRWTRVTVACVALALAAWALAGHVGRP